MLYDYPERQSSHDIKTAFIIHFKINDYEKEFNWSEIWTVNCDFRIR